MKTRIMACLTALMLLLAVLPGMAETTTETVVTATGTAKGFGGDITVTLTLDNGKIADVGTHDELLARSEIYRDVYLSQQKGVA